MNRNSVTTHHTEILNLEGNSSEDQDYGPMSKNDPILAGGQELAEDETIASNCDE